MDRRVERVEAAYEEQSGPSIPSWSVAGLLLAVLPLSFVAAGTSVLPGDVATTRFVQTNLPGVLEPVITAANSLGDAPAMLAIVFVVTIGLLLRGHLRPALIVAAASLAQLANLLLKLTLESPRPTSGLVNVSEQTTGFGFPSGHTMGTTVLALALFYVVTTLMADGLRRRLVQAGLLLTPLLMGISRIETGAHWPSDVLGAWLWGTLAAIAIITALSRPFNALSLPVTRPARTIQRSIAMNDVRRSVSQ